MRDCMVYNYDMPCAEVARPGSTIEHSARREDSRLSRGSRRSPREDKNAAQIILHNASRLCRTTEHVCSYRNSPQVPAKTSRATLYIALGSLPIFKVRKKRQIGNQNVQKRLRCV